METLAPPSSRPNPGHRQALLEEAGYDSYIDYQYGQSKYNKSLYGWGGHTQDGGTKYQDAGDLLHQLTLFPNLSDIVTSVNFIGYNDWDEITEIHKINSLVETSRYYFSQFCFLLKPKTKFVPGMSVYLHNNLAIDEAEIVLIDINLFSGRTILQHTLNNEGTKVKITYKNNCQTCYGQRFGIQIHQEVFDEEDLTKNCTIYPTAEYQSYNECDQKKGLAMLENMYGTGFTPIWAVENASEVSAKSSFVVNKAINVNLANGRSLSDCLLPCTVTKTSTRQVDDFKVPNQGFSLYFKDQMQVTTTTFVPFSLPKFLSDVGGVLGLWLGLGAVQLIELVLPRVNI